MDKDRLSRSGRVLAPSLLTIGNMACGFYSLLASHAGDFTAAGTCIVGGIVCDMLDGRIARLLRGESPFGVELDSLSDFLTFGIAPAYMMHAMLLKDYGVWGYLIAFAFAICGSLRLARFNAVAQAGHGSKTHFTGLPIPAAAGFLASFVLLYQIVEQDRPARTFPLLMSQIPLLATLGPLMVLTLSFLMVSTIPYGAFKQANLLRPENRKLLAVVLLVLTLLYFYPQNALFLLALLYVLSGPTGRILRSRRSPPAVPSVPS